MSGLAKVLLEKGMSVSGSDLQENSYTAMLSSQGAKIFKGHRASQVRGRDLVVYSSAVRPDNAELKEAQKNKIPVLSRLALFAEFTRPYKSIMVTGTHGKTTTAGLMAYLLLNLGLDPTVLLGGDLPPFGNARLGKSDYLVAELDESDGEFEKITPTLAIITNIENDHLDHFGSLARLKSAFCNFLKKIPSRKWLAFSGDKILKELNQSSLNRGLFYGLNSRDDFRAAGLTLGPSSSFNFFNRSKFLGQVRLSIPGRHNILNATAAIGAGLSLGLDFDKIKEIIPGFRGVARRFEIKGEVRGIKVIEDYGHHPTEIKATLAAARLTGPRRILVIFQPHRYSRTHLLKDEFSRAFTDADILAITDIYSASEKNISGTSSRDIVELIKKRKSPQAYFFKTPEEAAGFMVKEAGEGDLILVLGAGNVNRVSGWILAELK